MSVKPLNFPPNLGKEVAAGHHYMMIESYKSKNATAAGGLGDKLSSISLYIPAGSLKTSFTGNYEGKEGAALKAAGTSVAAGLSSKFGELFRSMDAAAAKGTIDAIGDVGNLIGQAGGGLLAQLSDKTGFVSASGNTPNNYMALVYGGPNEFRQHTFDFKFFPKNKPESDTVRIIIDEFKRGTLPRMSADVTGTRSGQTLLEPFFKSPRQHTIKFLKGNGDGGNTYLFNIGISVITNMSVNYDPQSTVGFHDDGSPVQIDMSLTFKEIAFQIEPDAESVRAENLAGPIRQNQSSAAQRAANLASLGGQNSTPGLGLGGGNDSFR